MEPWARRIKALLDSDPHLSQRGLADACGVKQPSISQWFNTTDSSKPPTRMLSGANLVAAARYLGTTAEYIMTGRAPESHAVRVDPQILGTANTLLQRLHTLRREEPAPDINPQALAIAYQVVAEDLASSAEGNVVDLMEKVAERL